VFIFIFCHACQVFEGVVLEGGGDFFGGLRWLIIFFCLVFIFNSQDALAFSHKVAASEAQSFGSGCTKRCALTPVSSTMVAGVPGLKSLLEALSVLCQHRCSQLGCDPKAFLDVQNDQEWQGWRKRELTA